MTKRPPTRDHVQECIDALKGDRIRIERLLAKYMELMRKMDEARP